MPLHGENGRQIGWLIEWDGQYWTGRGVTFHPDHDLAIRFARKQDAERIASWFLQDVPAVATEHVWIASGSEPAGPPAASKIAKSERT